MLKVIFLPMSSLFYSSYSQAEVLDKCPAFINRWVEAEGAWNFLSTSEAIFRLVQFSAIYSAVAALIYFVVRKANQKWFKYSPMAFTTLIALYLMTEFIPQDEPCSHYFWFKEIPQNLRWIQFGFDFVLLLVPLLVSLMLAAKSRKETISRSS